MLAGMDHIFSVLPKVLHKRGLSAHANASLVVVRAQRWLQENAPEIAPAVQVKKVEDGELLLACEHSIAAQECQPLLPRLLAHLRSQSPGLPIREIRLQRR